jgi:hypothetical protein
MPNIFNQLRKYIGIVGRQPTASAGRIGSASIGFAQTWEIIIEQLGHVQRLGA